MADSASQLKPLNHDMNLNEAIKWLAGDVTCADGWASALPPVGWRNNEGEVKNFVGEFLYSLDTKEYSNSKTIKQFYANGYTSAVVTKGFHQQETILSMLLSQSVVICHLTVRLHKTKSNKIDKNTYVTLHLYRTANGRFAGATRWNEETNEIWS